MADVTIPQMLADSVRRFGDRRALGRRDGDAYVYVTYAELWQRVRALERALTALGLSKGDRIALVSENRIEWAISDLAAQCLGLVTVPIYPSLPTSQVQYVVGDSAARVLIVSDSRQLAKALELRDSVRTLDHIVLMDGAAPDGVLPFGQLLQASRESPASDGDLDARAASVAPDDIATIIYTSGTTGDPKGAMLSHRALLHTGYAAREFVHLDESDVFLSFLPLCHVIERVGGHYLPLSIGALIVYSEGVFAIANELPAVEPTVFLCVPRLYESMQEKILEHRGRLPETQQRLFDWALGLGRAAAERRHAGRPAGPLLALQHAIGDRLVMRKVRERLGGRRARFFVSGGAPLNAGTTAFFEAIGITILEGYGLTEFPVISLNRPGQEIPGTVGPPLPGIETRVAPDGEILARGPSCMRSYFGKMEATRDAIDDAGWFHTGDIGEIAPGGSLKITDRKKDILVLANGKNVAPQPIEARLKESPYIAEAVLIGDRQATISALVVPAFDRLKDWARREELPAADLGDLVRRAETRKLIRGEIDRASEGLADFERIKRFTVLDRPFSIEGGELTPTLKVKRRIVISKYADVIAQMAR